MSDRCATCRFWTEDEEDIYGPYGIGWRYCTRAGFWDDKEHAEGARMQTVAADTWGLALWTAPDFGCVEHRPS